MSLVVVGSTNEIVGSRVVPDTQSHSTSQLKPHTDSGGTKHGSAKGFTGFIYVRELLEFAYCKYCNGIAIFTCFVDKLLQSLSSMIFVTFICSVSIYYVNHVIQSPRLENDCSSKFLH